MTLHYTDLGTDNRLEPAVHGADVLTHPMAKNTASISPRAVGSSAGKVITKDSRIIANDGTNNIGLFGFDDAGNMVVKVAKAGFDANSATNDQLIFNSAQNTFKIAAKVSGSFSVTSTSGAVGSSTITLTHNLGYVPETFSTVSISADWNGHTGIFPIPYMTPATNTGVDSAAVFILASYIRVYSVTTTTIVYEVGVLAGTSTISGTITAFVLQETAT